MELIVIAIIVALFALLYAFLNWIRGTDRTDGGGDGKPPTPAERSTAMQIWLGKLQRARTCPVQRGG